LKRALHTAARLGAEGVEIDARTELVPAEMSRTGVREFRKLLSDLSLHVSAVAFPTRRGYDVVDDLERVASARGFSGHLPLIRAYVGQGLRRDLEAFELRDKLVGHLDHEEAAQLDALDFRLLRGLADFATGRQGRDGDLQGLLRRYLDAEISLAKLADMLDISRFELTERFQRLGVPLRIGPANLDEAREEVRIARDQGKASKAGES